QLSLHTGHHHTCPTRRSSDLGVEHVAAQRLAPPLRTGTRFGGGPRAVVIVLLEREVHALPGDPVTLRVQCGEKIETLEQDRPLRSEEHTSELQSRENLVCRLL